MHEFLRFVCVVVYHDNEELMNDDVGTIGEDVQPALAPGCTSSNMQFNVKESFLPCWNLLSNNSNYTLCNDYIIDQCCLHNLYVIVSLPLRIHGIFYAPQFLISLGRWNSLRELNQIVMTGS